MKILERTLLKDLRKHLLVRPITVLTGLRRAGKTTLVKTLLQEIPSTNKIYFDLERGDNRLLFNEPNYENIITALEARGLNFKKKAYIAIDEIQLFPEITSVIKYLYDHYSIKFIITGSSSYYLKGHFTESLSGRKKIFELDTLSFGEFLTFKGVSYGMMAFPPKTFILSEYERLKRYYEEYLKFGGFPEVILERNHSSKKDLLRDILDSYIKIDIRTFTDFTNLRSLYVLLKALGARACTRIDYSKIASVVGFSRPTVYSYFELFEQTYLIKRMAVTSRNSDREIVKAPKLYFTDNGLLNTLAEVSSGVQFENSIFNQMKRAAKLRYYAQKTGQEIDFVLDSRIAIEAKETPGSFDLKAVKRLSEHLKISKQFIVFRHAPKVFEKDYIWGGDLLS